MNKCKEFGELVYNRLLKPHDMLYNSNALAGEVGEVANIVKKIIIRGTLPKEEVVSMKTMGYYFNNLKEELGDVLFYLIAVAETQGLKLEDLIDLQTKKINKLDKKYDKILLK